MPSCWGSAGGSNGTRPHAVRRWLRGTTIGKNPGRVESGAGGGGGGGGSSGGWLDLAGAESPRPGLVAPEDPAAETDAPRASGRGWPPAFAPDGIARPALPSAVLFDSRDGLDQSPPSCAAPLGFVALAAAKAASPPVSPIGDAPESAELRKPALPPCGVPGSSDAQAQGHTRAHARNTPDTQAQGPPRLVVVTATWCGPAPPSPAASARCAMLLPDMRGAGRAPFASEPRSTWWMMLASAAASPSAAAGRGERETGHEGTKSRSAGANRKRPRWGATSRTTGLSGRGEGSPASRLATAAPGRERGRRAGRSRAGGRAERCRWCYDRQQRPRSTGAAECRRPPPRGRAGASQAATAPERRSPAWGGGRAAWSGRALPLERLFPTRASGPRAQGCLTHHQPRAIWRRVCHCARDQPATRPSEARRPLGSRGAPRHQACRAPRPRPAGEGGRPAGTTCFVAPDRARPRAMTSVRLPATPPALASSPLSMALSRATFRAVAAATRSESRRLLALPSARGRAGGCCWHHRPIAVPANRVFAPPAPARPRLLPRRPRLHRAGGPQEHGGPRRGPQGLAREVRPGVRFCWRRVALKPRHAPGGWGRPGTAHAAKPLPRPPGLRPSCGPMRLPFLQRAPRRRPAGSRSCR